MFIHTYDSIITIPNLLLTWEKFSAGKRHRRDVIEFQANLGTKIHKLYRDLHNKTYIHGAYEAFNISDPKPRNIHKATVRDRIVHHLLYQSLYPFFHERFIHDSYSCQKHKGTHKALERFKYFAGKVSKNNTQSCYVLKGDVKKFFASIDHVILLKILDRYIVDESIKSLLSHIIDSFCVSGKRVGLPLGNLTSQLLVNIYMHEFDMFVKQELKVRFYIRYADDFAILSHRKLELEILLLKLEVFLDMKLGLKLHENKVYIKTFSSGVDFLGWVHFTNFRRIRTTTKRNTIPN